jgi:putative membrane protein
MTKRSAATAILVAVLVSVGLATVLVAAQPDQNSNSSATSNMNQNGNMNSNMSGSNKNTSMLGSSDRKFMMEAAMGGMEEVELGKLAAERGSTDAIKQFGQRMVDEHTKANEELMQIASMKGVALPTTLDDKHKADVTKMSQLSGAAFDSAYVKEAGVKDHNKAVKLFQSEADKGKDADLKAFASKTLPTIQEHLRMAQDMENGMRGNKNKSMSGGNANMSGNMNASGNSNMSNTNMAGNSNMSTSNENMSGNDNMSGNSNMSNSNMSNSNGNSNTTNANGNSNTPR